MKLHFELLALLVEKHSVCEADKHLLIDAKTQEKTDVEAFGAKNPNPRKENDE